MPSGIYQTVFELGIRSFPWSAMLHPTLFILLGFALVRFAGKREICQLVGALGIIFGSLSFVLLGISLVPKFIAYRRAYVNGNSSVIEGTIKDFHPMPALGPATESFSIHGSTFSYNVLDATPCFHNSPPHKGPLHSGLSVRIYYKDGCIQRLDVRR